MKTRALLLLVLFTLAPARAHRLDEYLQATLLSVEKDRVEAQVRLTPGVAVLPLILAQIDSNRDGILSAARVDMDQGLRAWATGFFIPERRQEISRGEIRRWTGDARMGYLKKSWACKRWKNL